MTINFNDLNVISAKNFREMLNDNNVYLYIGKSSAWDDEDNPDTPVNTDDENISVRSNIEYIIKLDYEDSILSIPRYDWTINTVYAEYSSDDAELIDNQFYVLTSSNNVYKCIGNNDGAESTITPTGTSVNQFTLADGYTWKFMYNLSSPVSTKFLNNDYIPLPDGNRKTTLQTLVEDNATYVSGSPINGHGADASYELFARYVTLSTEIDLTSFTPDIEHRQYGIIVNPTLDNGTLLTNDDYLLSDISFDEHSGRILTLRNHEVISSTDGSTEKFQIIVKF